MKKDNNLKGPDILLNLERIDIHNMDAYSSSSCSGGVSFHFGDTKHGCVEDPDMTGHIRVLKTERKKGRYVLEVVFEKETNDF